MASKDSYVKLLQKAVEDLDSPDGISFDEFKQRVNELGIKQQRTKLWHIIYSGNHAQQNQRLHMNLESFFQYIEYEELRHSLASSKDAKRQAKTAMWVAIISIGIQVAIESIKWILGH